MAILGNDWQHNFEVQPPRGRGRRNATASLWELARREATVRTVLEHWQSGYFDSFEEALAYLAVTLATQKQAAQQQAYEAMALASPPPITFVAAEKIEPGQAVYGVSPLRAMIEKFMIPKAVAGEVSQPPPAAADERFERVPKEHLSAVAMSRDGSLGPPAEGWQNETFLDPAEYQSLAVIDDPERPPCTCDSQTLVAQGCQCGGV